MREWYRELREDYKVSRSYQEGFCEWYIKRKAPDSVRQILAYSIFFFGVYLWTNIQLSILLIELGSVGYILIVLYEWIQKLRMKKIENQLKKGWRITPTFFYLLTYFTSTRSNHEVAVASNTTFKSSIF